MGKTKVDYKNTMNSVHKHDMPNWRVDNIWAFALSIVTTIFTIAFFYFSMVGDIRFIKQELVYIRKDLTDVKEELRTHEASSMPFRADVTTLKAQVAICCPR
jgi:hypothetical protein